MLMLLLALLHSLRTLSEKFSFSPFTAFSPDYNAEAREKNEKRGKAERSESGKCIFQYFYAPSERAFINLICFSRKSFSDGKFSFFSLLKHIPHHKVIKTSLYVTHMHMCWLLYYKVIFSFVTRS